VRLLPTAVIIVVVILPVAQQAYAEFSFHSQFSYVDETKIMHILGEIRNESDTAMGNVLIKISFYDKEGNLLDEFSRVPALDVINPGESSPFEILYLDPKTVDSVANFTMSAMGQAAEQKEKQLEIISSNSRLDLLGTYYINAAARNNGLEPASNAIMIATLYDREGKVVAIGKALAEASPGSSNMTVGSEAAFGIAITEKLQTYRTARYSLVVDSDQYVSDTIVLPASGPGLNPPGNQSQSGCLIATAAFGSELAPQVQQLRLFRDGIALKTSAGNSFMNVFNAWYYSFSPSVANYERQEPWLQNTVRILIYPLLGILTVSTFVHDSLAFSSEIGIVAAGVTASSLVGLLYFAPFGAALGIASRKRQWNMSSAGLVLACSWAASALAIALAEMVAVEAAMMFGTSLLVLSAISTAVIAVARAIVKL
jgi:hypothetical protein